MLIYAKNFRGEKIFANQKKIKFQFHCHKSGLRGHNEQSPARSPPTDESVYGQYRKMRMPMRLNSVYKSRLTSSTDSRIMQAGERKQKSI